MEPPHPWSPGSLQNKQKEQATLIFSTSPAIKISDDCEVIGKAYLLLATEED